MAPEQVMIQLSIIVEPVEYLFDRVFDCVIFRRVNNKVHFLEGSSAAPLPKQSIIKIPSRSVLDVAGRIQDIRFVLVPDGDSLFARQQTCHVLVVQDKDTLAHVFIFHVPVHEVALECLLGIDKTNQQPSSRMQ